MFHPQLVIHTAPFVPIATPKGMSVAAASVYPSFLSYTGLLCIGGAVAAAAYFGFMILFGSRIAMKRFHVVMMAPDEYAPLQQKIKETAQKLHIAEPKVGLVDDLLPNAFTIGHERGTVLVSSLGLLNMLELDELSAVVSHELAHVKAKDYLFKTASYALNLLSFFNPLSYLTASRFQKERELLADEKAVALLGKPSLMAEVLTKVEAAVQGFPKPSFADRLSSSLFLLSPLAHRPGILASHPKITQRIQNIYAAGSAPFKKRRYVAIAALFLGFLVCASVAVGFSMVQVQKEYSQQQIEAMAGGQGVFLYNTICTFDPEHPTGIVFANESDFQYFFSAITIKEGYLGRFICYSYGNCTVQGYNFNCYIDGNGVAYNFSSAPDIGCFVIIDARDIVVDGKTPFIGNVSYPVDPSHPTGVYLANQSGLQPEAIGYVAKNGVAYTFDRPIIGVWFNSTGACIPQYWPNPAPTWCSYSEVFNSPQPAQFPPNG